MPANGSSSKINAGLIASARAISTRRLSPPDSEYARFRAMCVIPNSSSSARVRRSRSAKGRSIVSNTERRFSSTVSLRNTDASCGR